MIQSKQPSLYICTAPLSVRSVYSVCYCYHCVCWLFVQCARMYQDSEMSQGKINCKKPFTQWHQRQARVVGHRTTPSAELCSEVFGLEAEHFQIHIHRQPLHTHLE